MIDNMDIVDRIRKVGEELKYKAEYLKNNSDDVGKLELKDILGEVLLGIKDFEVYVFQLWRKLP